MMAARIRVIDVCIRNCSKLTAVVGNWQELPLVTLMTFSRSNKHITDSQKWATSPRSWHLVGTGRPARFYRRNSLRQFRNWRGLNGQATGQPSASAPVLSGTHARDVRSQTGDIFNISFR